MLECRKQGALLVSINTEDELHFLTRELLQAGNISVWIGGSDKDQGKIINQMKEDEGKLVKCVPMYVFSYTILISIADGVYEWEDGSDLGISGESWEEWYQGQPDIAGDQKYCMVLSPFNMQTGEYLNQVYWFSHRCDVEGTTSTPSVQGYICEGVL